MIRRAVAFSLAQRYGEIAVQSFALAVLARLVAPAEFGVFATSAAIVAVAIAFSEFGQLDYLIQERKLTTERRSAALGLSLLASTLFALFTLSAGLLLPANWLAPDMAVILLVLSIVLLIQPFTRSLIASLHREMRFGPVCAIGILRAGCTACVGIALALQGLGALALAIGFVAGAVAELVGAFVVRKEIVSPRLAGWREVSRFGFMRTAITGLNKVGDAGSILAIGHFLDYAAVGVVDRSRRVSDLFQRAVLEAVRPVVLPILVERERRGQDHKEAYLFKVSSVSASAWSFFGFVVLFAAPIVEILLGSQWNEAISIVQILCLMGIFSPFNSFSNRFYIGLGMLNILLRFQIIVQGARLALVSASALVSLEAVAVAFASTAAVKCFLEITPLKRRLRYGLRELVSRLTVSLAVAAAALLPSVVLVVSKGPVRSDDFLLLLLGGIMTTCGFLLGLALTRHPLFYEFIVVSKAVMERMGYRASILRSR